MNNKATKPNRSKRPVGLFGAWPAVVSVLFGLVVWQIISGALGAAKAPSPEAVVVAAAALLKSHLLIADLLYSLGRVIVGFVIAMILAVPLGFVLGWYRGINAFVDPWLQFFRMIPPIAVIPLIIVYLGIGEVAKVWVIFFAAFLVLIISVYQGVRHVSGTYIKAARVLGASDYQLFFNVVVPATMPHMITGMRIAIAAAWTTVVAAELIAASHGLGFLIMSASQTYDLPTMYVGIGLIGIVGLVMDRMISRLERRVLAWSDSSGR